MALSWSTPEERGYRDPGSVSRILVAFLAAQAVAQPGWMLFSDAAVGEPGLFDGIVVLSQFAAWGVLAAFVAWVRRVVLNSRTLSTTTITRSPWAGFWWLVPICPIRVSTRP